MAKRMGNMTISFDKEISVTSYASVVGPKEKQGPLGKFFDKAYDDELFGESSFEKAESRLQQLAVKTALAKGDLLPADIDLICAGDLLNQCIGSAYGLRELHIPFVGLYGACSTMALGIINASVAVESGAADRAVAVTSSHFCSSERQFRFPLEYGGQRPQTSQWTVTGSGAAVLSRSAGKIKVNAAAIGKINDFNITDMNNMGAAMAPAAADTIMTYLADTGTSADDYDLILTGDLGYTGSDLFLGILHREGINLSRHNDCGMMIFDRTRQDVHSGGSGCGCSASVLCSKILEDIKEKRLNNVLFCATGALMSPTSCMQGESIPAIAHLVNLVSA